MNQNFENTTIAVQTFTKTLTEDTTANNNKLDVLLIIDDSPSMYADARKLAVKLKGFVDHLKNSNIDWQMCIATTSVDDDLGQIEASNGKSGYGYYGEHGEHGEPIRWQGGNSDHILKKNSGDLNQIFIDTIDYLFDNTHHKTGRSRYEKGIKAMNFSIQEDNNNNCYRDKAALSVIVISDEDESDRKNTPQSFIETVENTFSPGKRLTVHSIVVTDEQCTIEQYGPEDSKLNHTFIGKKYMDLSNLTGGSIQSICLNDYTAALNDIYKKIDQSLDGISLSCVPTDKPTITVNGRDYTPYVVVGGDNQLFFDPPVQAPATVSGNYYCES